MSGIASCCQKSSICHYAFPVICLITTVALTIISVCMIMGYIGHPSTCTFVAAGLLFCAMAFLITAGYQFKKKC